MESIDILAPAPEVRPGERYPAFIWPSPVPEGGPPPAGPSGPEGTKPPGRARWVAGAALLALVAGRAAAPSPWR